MSSPFQIQLYGQGDYIAFTSQGFAFLAIYFLWKALENRHSLWLFFPLSVCSILLSINTFQVFVLGLALYFALFGAFTIWLPETVTRAKLKDLGKFASRFLIIPLLLAPLLLPLISAPISLAPSSAYAPSFSTFSANSASPIAIFLLAGYTYTSSSPLPNSIGYQMVVSAGGPTTAGIWFWCVVVMVVLTWVLVIVYRDRRGYLLLALATAGSIFGSGPYGPLGFFNSYLYLHAPGYQILNASYYWDWVIVAPVFALALGVVAERSLDGRIQRWWKNRNQAQLAGRYTAPLSLPSVFLRVNRRRMILLGAVCLACAVLTSSALPIATGAQNGSLGIHGVNYPADYNEIPALLTNLIGSGYAGVALFNPDTNWFLFNSSHYVPNAFYSFPTVRTPGLPVYGAPDYSSNFYFYWVYEEFYTNATRYIGQLLALAGIEFLLVFYGTEAASSYPYFLPFSFGKNASQLMVYQTGIVPVFSSPDFEIFRNLAFTASRRAVRQSLNGCWRLF